MTSTPTLLDRAALLDRYDTVRTQTEILAQPLSPEDQTVQSMPDVSPTKWHRAHVTWFFETFVLAEGSWTPSGSRGLLFTPTPGSSTEPVPRQPRRPAAGHATATWCRT
jgi:hypothetical protein